MDKRVTSPAWGPPPPRKHALRLAKQRLCACITLFSTFLCRHCTTTTWKCLISRFVEDVNTRQWPSFSFSELRYTLLEFNSSKNCEHLTNWTRWNKCDKVWSSATSLFKWRFRSRRRRGCLSSIMLVCRRVCLPGHKRLQKQHTVKKAFLQMS